VDVQIGAPGGDWGCREMQERDTLLSWESAACGPSPFLPPFRKCGVGRSGIDRGNGKVREGVVLYSSV